MNAFGRSAGSRLLAALAVFSMGLPAAGFALDPAKGVLQYNIQTWGRQKGLPVNGINAITQGRDGYLWLGTRAGLVRFDGIEFKLVDLTRVSELRSSIVNSLAPAQDGGLWVGLENGSFGFYDERGFAFRGRQAWGDVNMNVRTVLEGKDGTLWFAAGRQAARLTRDGTYEEVLGTDGQATPNVLRAFEDSRGRVWFGTAGQGLYWWEAGKLSKLPNPPLGSIAGLAEDRDGRIWVGTSGGLTCYSPQLERIEIPPLAVEIRYLLVDRHGVLWIATAGQGLVRYQDGAYTHLRRSDGLAGDYVTALAEDREGSLWIGTREGVSQLMDVRFPTHAMTQDPLLREVGAVGASQRGGVWVGSALGVTYFDGQAQTYAAEAGLPPGSIKRVFEASNGDVYLVCKLNTLLILSQGKIVARHDAPTLVVGMAEDAHGVVVSVGGKLFRAGRDYLTPYVFTEGEPIFDWILNLAPGRDGSIWVACATGIFAIKDGRFKHVADAQSLPDAHVQMVYEDDEGVVWGALLTGIARVKNNAVRCITRKDGLLDDNIYAIIPDDLGHLWVDSGRGIFRVSRKSMSDFADGTISRVECVAYDGQESVQSVDKTQMQERVGCKSRDGRIWFPSGKGVVVIDPAHVPTNGVAPPVHIDRIRANGAEFARSEHTVVPPGTGELEVHYTGLSLIAAQKMRFRYKLEGYDLDWVQAGDRRLAFYANLKPGRYTLRVMAANADGVWNEAGDAATIELLPHFYQTVWFDFLCGGLALAALAGIFAWRVRHLQRKQRALQEARDQLKAEVASRTADLATANTSLHREVGDHQLTEAQLKLRTQALEGEIEERKRMQLEIERVHGALMQASRQAGMAEVATSVLHNVGNVLNSINVSAILVSEKLAASESGHLAKVCTLLRSREAELGAFFHTDPKGRQVLGFLETMSEHFATEKTVVGQEIESLRRNVNHVKDIVDMQQSYARVSGVTETIGVDELVEDALRMNEGALVRHHVTLLRDFQVRPTISVEKHKVLQILVNLIRNAKYACDDSARTDKRLVLRITADERAVRIEVVDNGVGIPAENLTRIFNHGFTTRKTGHGFGLHSGALAARELGGSLRVESAGVGRGAAFTLELPMQPPEVVAGPVHHAATHA